MTPIKVGRYEIRRQGTWFVIFMPSFPDSYVWRARYQFRTLPMALCVAAEAAEVQRQRVRLYDGDILTGFGDEGWIEAAAKWRSNAFLQAQMGEFAHKCARRRYAALGGAA